MKRLLFIVFALIGSAAVLYAQVYDYYFENRDAFKTFPCLKPGKFKVSTRLLPDIPYI